ncbi:MAG TPA: putative Ig domain-containing protein, partial [Rhodocyclaceae bacterium]|nr:putative Ig domain-containing protein [Rhodocyclaceae bacterium]
KAPDVTAPVEPLLPSIQQTPAPSIPTLPPLAVPETINPTTLTPTTSTLTPLPVLPPSNDVGVGTPLVSVSGDAGSGSTIARLEVVTQPGSQIVESGREMTVQLPQGVFRNTDSAANTKVEAVLADGQPLPNWLRFDSTTGKFSGTPPTGSEKTLDIKVLARDDHGNSASTQFVLQVNENPSKAVESPSAAPVSNSGATSTMLPDATTTPVETAKDVSARTPATNSAEMPLDSHRTTANPTPAPTSPSTSTAPAEVAKPSALVAQGVDSARTISNPSATSALATANTGLFLVAAPAEREMIAGREMSFQLPPGLFRHTNSDAKVTVEALRADGQALPNWLKFDAATGKFAGAPPADARGVIDVRVTARDNEGRQVSTEFRIRISDLPDESEPATKPTSEPVAKPISPQSGLTPQQDTIDAGEEVEQKDVAPSIKPLTRGRASFTEQLAKYGRAGNEHDRGLLLKQLQRVNAHRSAA